jgi:hypothetical protein
MDLQLFAKIVTQFPLLRPQAYLDPGSGSFLIQILIAGLVGAAFIIRGSWKKIKGLFKHETPDPDAEQSDDDTEQQ